MDEWYLVREPPATPSLQSISNHSLGRLQVFGVISAYLPSLTGVL